MPTSSPSFSAPPASVINRAGASAAAPQAVAGGKASLASTGTNTATQPILDVHDLTVAYHRKPVLWDLDLTIREPKLIGVIGPNGAGKSTLIKAILGLAPLASGEVTFWGLPLSQVRRRVGYVPQRESVDWDFPVRVVDVVLMGTYGKIGWFRRPRHPEKQTAMQCLEKVGMAEFAHRQIGQLSGGQQQRVFLARALAQNADIYFMDEPMAGVDAATERAIFTLLQELRATGKTVLVVHHDLRTITEYFDETILINMRLIAHGPTAEVFIPDNIRKAYGGRLAILDTLGEAFQARERSG